MKTFCKTLNPLFLAVATALVSGCDRAGPGFLERDAAMAVVVDKTATASDLDLAIRSLKSKAMDLSFWLDVADNADYDPHHRRACIQQIFENYPWKSTSPSDLALTLGTPVWLKEAEVEEIKFLMGFVPVIWDSTTQSLFVIRVLPDPESGAHLGIYISTTVRVPETDFAAAIRMPAAITNDPIRIYDLGTVLSR